MIPTRSSSVDFELRCDDGVDDLAAFLPVLGGPRITVVEMLVPGFADFRREPRRLPVQLVVPCGRLRGRLRNRTGERTEDDVHLLGRRQDSTLLTPARVGVSRVLLEQFDLAAVDAAVAVDLFDR